MFLKAMENIRKKALLIILSVSLLYACSTLNKTNQIVLAKVNDYIITEDYFKKKCKRLYGKDDISGLSYEEKHELLKNEIKAHLLIEAALASGIDKTEDFRHAMHIYREQTLISLYYKMMCRELEKEVHITKEEVEKLYNDMAGKRTEMPPLKEVAPDLKEEICNLKIKDAINKIIEERYKKADITIYEDNLREAR